MRTCGGAPSLLDSSRLESKSGAAACCEQTTAPLHPNVLRTSEVLRQSTRAVSNFNLRFVLPWIVFAGFAVSAALEVCVFQRKPPADPASWTLPDLAEHIRREHPRLHIIPTNSNGILSDGFYVSRRRDVTFSSASCLVCQPECLDDWRGVALCQRSRPDPDPQNASQEIASWGDAGVRVGKTQIVGDPALIRQIAIYPLHLSTQGR